MDNITQKLKLLKSRVRIWERHKNLVLLQELKAFMDDTRVIRDLLASQSSSAQLLDQLKLFEARKKHIWEI